MGISLLMYIDFFDEEDLFRQVLASNLCPYNSSYFYRDISFSSLDNPE